MKSARVVCAIHCVGLGKGAEDAEETEAQVTPLHIAVLGVSLLHNACMLSHSGYVCYVAIFSSLMPTCCASASMQALLLPLFCIFFQVFNIRHGCVFRRQVP